MKKMLFVLAIVLLPFLVGYQVDGSESNWGDIGVVGDESSSLLKSDIISFNSEQYVVAYDGDTKLIKTYCYDNSKWNVCERTVYASYIESSFELLTVGSDMFMTYFSDGKFNIFKWNGDGWIKFIKPTVSCTGGAPTISVYDNCFYIAYNDATMMYPDTVFDKLTLDGKLTSLGTLYNSSYDSNSFPKENKICFMNGNAYIFIRLGGNNYKIIKYNLSNGAISAMDNSYKGKAFDVKSYNNKIYFSLIDQDTNKLSVNIYNGTTWSSISSTIQCDSPELINVNGAVYVLANPCNKGVDLAALYRLDESKKSFVKEGNDIGVAYYATANSNASTVYVALVSKANSKYKILVKKKTVLKAAEPDSPVEPVTPTVSPVSSVTLSGTRFTYNGNNIKPAVIVKSKDGKTVSNSYYSVSYATECKNPGSYSVGISFKGIYSSTAKKTLTYSIIPGNNKISSCTNDTSVVVNWTKAAGANGYEIYRNSSRIAQVSGASTLKYVDTAANVSGTKYAYYVVPYYKNTAGAITKASASATLTTYFAKAPAISSTTIKSNGITVNWNKITGVDGYILKIVQGSNTRTITISGNATVSKLVDGLSNGKEYSFFIRSYKTVSGTKYYSNYSVASKRVFLSQTSITSITNGSNKNIVVNWKRNSIVDGYQVCLKRNNARRYVAASGNATVSTEVGSLAANSLYNVYVRTYKTVGGVKYYSAWSAYKNAYYIARPTIIALSNSGNGKVTIKWSKNSAVTGYQIRYRVGTKVKNVTVGSYATVSKVLSSLDRKSTYYFAVRSYKKVGTKIFYSKYSAAKTIKTK